MTLSIAIVGGGPGGLMTAWHLRAKVGNLADITLLEASERLGGKILTCRIGEEGALYEAGVAEIYGYGTIGPDPLGELIASFGLTTTPMDSDMAAFEGVIVNGVAGMEKAFGKPTAKAISAFRKLCAKAMTPQAYYEGSGKIDNDHPWAERSAESVLEEAVEDPIARKFFKIMARSDIASELHVTNALNALKNYLMDVDGYIDVYSIDGGNERLIDGLKGAHDARVELGTRVLSVEKTADERYRLETLSKAGRQAREFDFVILCLPHNWLGTLEFRGERLRQAMSRHIAHFDRPAHYLRVVALFDEPIWEGLVEGAWFMSDAFGGCCVYIEGARHDCKGRGVLNWLIAGADALAYVNVDDAALVETALGTLPPAFGDARAHVLQSRVHRWISSVNAIPGGVPVRDARANHIPEPKDNPGLFAVGDYLFDSTLNGLLDSADAATDFALSALMMKRYRSGMAKRHVESLPQPFAVPSPSARLDKVFFDDYRASGPYASAWKRFHDPSLTEDLLRMAWKFERAPKVLVAGSASGEFVGALRARGLDAWGLEPNAYAHDRTPKDLARYNKRGPLGEAPFKDKSFDVVIDFALGRLSQKQVGNAIWDYGRLARKGVFLETIGADFNDALADRYDLLRGMKSLNAYWVWSEAFADEDFSMTIEDDAALARMWARVIEAGKGPGAWYDDADTLRYSFYDAP